MKLLDCTLRDGGYYTNWDFDENLIDIYCNTMESLPIEYIEIGYRSNTLSGYYGEFFYCPEYLMKKLKDKMPSKKLAIILNEKDIRADDVVSLINPCIKYISLVRIAVDPKNFDRATLLAKEIKNLGFEVAFNVMYMSEWKNYNSFLDKLKGMENIIDYFYMVDSFGGIMNEELVDILELVKSKSNIPICFHGHNNLEMALSNTVKSIDLGCEIVDSTITGMGRGAGNLKTELLISYLFKDSDKINYKKLSECVSVFEKLKTKYNWGTNLPYMISGVNSLPQKDVMQWIGMNRYNLNTIVNTLNNNNFSDNVDLKKFKLNKKVKSVLIIGGGPSVKNSLMGIFSFLKKNPNILLIHTGLKYIKTFEKVKNDQLYCMSGYESDDLQTILNQISIEKSIFVYPPTPRKMDIEIPDLIKNKSYQIGMIDFTEKI